MFRRVAPVILFLAVSAMSSAIALDLSDLMRPDDVMLKSPKRRKVKKTTKPAAVVAPKPAAAPAPVKETTKPAAVVAPKPAAAPASDKETDKPAEAAKPAEPVIVERTVTNVVERVVVKPVEKIVVAPPVTSVVERVVEKPVERIVVAPPVTNVVERVVEKPVERVVVAPPVTNVVERVVEKPVEKIVEKTSVLVVEHTNVVEKAVIVEKPVIVEKQVVVEKPVETIVEKEVFVDRPVTNTVERKVVVERTNVVEKIVVKKERDTAVEDKLKEDKKALEEKLAARERELAQKEKQIDYLRNPDPDERPVAAAQPSSTNAAAATPKPYVKPKRTPRPKTALTGRPARITALHTDYDRKDGIIFFDQNVYVDDEQYQMHADKLYVFLEGTNDLKRLIAIGHVAITNDAKMAYCTKASYARKAGKMVLYSGDGITAEIRDESKEDDQILRGEKITFWLNSDQVEVVKPEITAPAGNGLKGGAKGLLGK